VYPYVMVIGGVSSHKKTQETQEGNDCIGFVRYARLSCSSFHQYYFKFHNNQVKWNNNGYICYECMCVAFII